MDIDKFVNEVKRLQAENKTLATELKKVMNERTILSKEKDAMLMGVKKYHKALETIQQNVTEALSD